MRPCAISEVSVNSVALDSALTVFIGYEEIQLPLCGKYAAFLRASMVSVYMCAIAVK